MRGRLPYFTIRGTIVSPSFDFNHVLPPAVPSFVLLYFTAYFDPWSLVYSTAANVPGDTNTSLYQPRALRAVAWVFL